MGMRLDTKKNMKSPKISQPTSSLKRSMSDDYFASPDMKKFKAIKEESDEMVRSLYNEPSGISE